MEGIPRPQPSETDRAALAKSVTSLRPGDTLLVTKLDRLARSTRDLLNTLDAIGKAGAVFRSLGDPLGRYHNSPRAYDPRRLGRIRATLDPARTSEGRKRAQARGVRFGRKPKLTPYQIEQALARRQASEALTEIGRTFGVSHSTISRLGEGA